jgi:hypothetical protein
MLLSSPAGDLAAQLHALPPRAPLGSSTLRALLGPPATVGLGSAAGISLQTQFDRCVATLRYVVDGLSASASLMRELEAAAGGDVDSGVDGGGGGSALAVRACRVAACGRVRARGRLCVAFAAARASPA